MDKDLLRFKASPVHMQAVHDFTSALFNGTTEEFWNMLSDVCQVSIFTVYKTYIENAGMNDYDGFKDYLETVIREENREIYSLCRTKYGVSDVARYTSDGEVIMHLVEKFQAGIHYIAPTLINATPIRLALNLKFNQETQTYSPHWKVRVVGYEFKTALDV